MAKDIAYKAIVVPTCILIGMYIAGALIGGFLEMPNQFAAIFTAAGGLPAVGAYFYKLWFRN